jgi:Cys-rich protein (TIGR01571 family)
MLSCCGFGWVLQVRFSFAFSSRSHPRHFSRFATYTLTLTHSSKQIGSRGNIRDRYRIEGGGCGDCMSAWCCTPCELTQESRELELEEKALLQAGGKH